ncbi:serine/threonine-protein kinase pim-3-like [Triplophysa rosa]|uniref:serine/threonine-protein kinase pim-3-like n=1 Tax=Triplophysa rosa TaxID=992332 RepID=UPI002545E3DA|nr:serine/threonine-protein kinase pim-3-like [Triplophysa rosa]
MSCERGVFHSHVKLENLLINKDTLDVKLIDFSCGRQILHPEFFKTGMYHGKPDTVWSRGGLSCGNYPTSDDLHTINENLWFKECCSLIQCCLQQNPEQCIHLGKILLHERFKVYTAPVAVKNNHGNGT